METLLWFVNSYPNKFLSFRQWWWWRILKGHWSMKWIEYVRYNLWCCRRENKLFCIQKQINVKRKHITHDNSNALESQQANEQRAQESEQAGRLSV